MKLIMPIIGVIIIYTYGMNTGLLFCIAYVLAVIADILNNKFPTK